MANDKNIAFFSSDYRFLYKLDIFRALALPTNSVIQFRYQKEWIHDDILSNLSDIKNKNATIFFAPVGKNEYYSIRNVKIIDYKEQEDLNIIVFFLKLQDFVDYSINLTDTEGKLPSDKKFLSKLTLSGNVAPWGTIIDRIKDYFEDVLFFYIKSIKQNCFTNKEIKASYNDKIKQTNFELTDENEYIFDIVFYDLSGGKNILKISDNHNLININSDSKFSIGAPRDTQNILIDISPVEEKDKTTIMSFNSSPLENSNQEDNYNLLLPIKVKRDILKPCKYGFWTFIGFLALSINTYIGSVTKGAFNINSNIQIGSAEIKIYYLMLLVALLASVATSQLYKLFNKK